MATVFFANSAGYVTVFQDPGVPASITFRVEGFGGFFTLKAFFTRASLGTRGNYQFSNSMGEDTFLYVFGDLMGRMSVSGLAFDSTCQEAVGTLGIERVLEYYRLHRLAERKTPLRIVIGRGTVILGYLADLTASMVDPRARVWQFDLQFEIVPPGRESLPSASDDEESDEEEPIPTGTEDEPTGGSGGGDDTGRQQQPQQLSTTDIAPLPDRGGAVLDPAATATLEGDGFSLPSAGPTLRLVLPFASS